MRLHPSLAAVIAACALTLALTACSGDDPGAVENPGSPGETTGPVPDAAAADAISVAVDYVDVQLLDNAVLRGEEQRQPTEGVVDAAVEQARTAIERYLNAQFVDPATRYGTEGHTGLLREGADEGLTEEERKGLGELDLTTTVEADGPILSQAVVLTDGDELLSVTMVYDAVLTLPDATEGTLRQHAELLFPAPQEDGSWRADLLEMTLELPEEPTS